ncbi:MAG: vitamin K epoxide reductase family protein, partial [Acidobacteriaceae bacterium]
TEPSVVHSVLFWVDGCPSCTQALTETLPPIQEKYTFQLNLLLVELATMQDTDNLYALGAALGLSKQQVEVPLLLVDHMALIGVDEIQNRLPGLVEQYIAAGGVDYPDIPLLGEMLSKGIPFSASSANLQLIPQVAGNDNSLGMTLAWVTMGLMVFALLLAIVTILRAFQGKPLGEIKGWLDIAIPILALIGLGASIYLTYVEFTHTRALCGPVGDCNAVQSSPYAKLFGILPIGLLGALGYSAILVTWLWRRFRTDALARSGGPIMYAMALFGLLFSIYLTYLELFVIRAVCLWCLTSAVIITALMLLNLPHITQWLAISDEED